MLKECTHQKKKLLSLSSSEYQHEYCPVCGWHRYKDVEYTKEAWDKAFVDEEAGQ